MFQNTFFSNIFQIFSLKLLFFIFVYPNMKYGGIPNNLRDKFQQLNPKKSMVSAIEDIFGEWPYVAVIIHIVMMGWEERAVK